MNDLQKLPKWARQRIDLAERNLAHVRDELAEARGAVGVVGQESSDYRLRLTESKATYVLTLPSGESVDFFIVGDAMRLRGSKRLVLKPNVSNSVDVEVESR